MQARSQDWGIFVSKSAVAGFDHQPPDGDQHPDHGLVGAALFPVKIRCRLGRYVTYREAVR